MLGSRTPGLDGGQRVEGLQAGRQRQLQRLLGLEVLKKRRTRPSRVDNSKQDGSIPLIDNRGVGPALTCPAPCHPMTAAEQHLSCHNFTKLRAHSYSISVRSIL